MTKPALVNLKGLPYGGAEAVVSSAFTQRVQEMIRDSAGAVYDNTVQSRFLEQYRDWVLSSKENKFTGLEDFKVACFSNGTTESFDKFYLDNCTRRFRCFRGEYMYHQASWRNYFDWLFLDDEPLGANDAVVISMPFSDFGFEHPGTQEILNQAEKLSVPVLIDCAFFGICSGINFDFSHPAITAITFSLSKSFPVANLRIGMRLTRQDDDDSLLVMNKTNYTNRLGAAVGIQYLTEFGPDWNSLRWREAQQKLCAELGVTPSNTVIFGIDDRGKYPQYSRGNSSNRLCLSKYMESQRLP